MRSWAIEIAALELGDDDIDIRRKKKGFLSVFRSSGKVQKTKTLTTQELEAVFNNDHSKADQFLHAHLPRSYVMTAVNVHLRRVFVDLLNPDSSEMLSLSVFDLAVDLKKRKDNLGLHVSIFATEVREHICLRSKFPYILTVRDGNSATLPRDHQGRLLEKNMRGDRLQPILDINFEQNPLDEALEADTKVIVKQQSVDIIFNPEVITTLGFFFAPPESIDMSGLEDVAHHTFEGISETTSTHLMSALDSHTRTYVEVEVFAPTIIIPESLVDASRNILVAELGHFSLGTHLVPISTQKGTISKFSKGTIKLEDSKEWEHFYDSYELKGSDITAFLCTGGREWRQAGREEAEKKGAEGSMAAQNMSALGKKRRMRRSLLVSIPSKAKHSDDVLATPTAGHGRLVLIEPFSLNVRLSMCILPASVYQLPRISTTGTLEQVRLTLSCRGYRRLMKVLAAITPSDDMEEMPLSPRSNATIEEINEEEEEKLGALGRDSDDEEEEVDETKLDDLRMSTMTLNEEMSVSVMAGDGEEGEEEKGNGEHKSKSGPNPLSTNIKIGFVLNGFSVLILNDTSSKTENIVRVLEVDILQTDLAVVQRPFDLDLKVGVQGMKVLDLMQGDRGADRGGDRGEEKECTLMLSTDGEKVCLLYIYI